MNSLAKKLETALIADTIVVNSSVEYHTEYYKVELRATLSDVNMIFDCLVDKNNNGMFTPSVNTFAFGNDEKGYVMTATPLLLDILYDKSISAMEQHILLNDIKSNKKKSVLMHLFF
jgi:hypothetical protein